MDTEKILLVEALKNKECETYLQNTFERAVDKHRAEIAEYSEQARNKGNQLYLQKNHDAETHMQIFDYYCQSISYAPLNSELLAKAYGNRSAFLLHINKYEDCIIDIDRALKITESDVLTIKLLCRKVECMKKLALPDYHSVLENAENLAEKVYANSKSRIDVLIDKVKACSIGNRKVSRNQSVQNDSLFEKNEPFDCVSIEYSEKYGRLLIAKKDYNPGDFIFREKLYGTVLNKRLQYTHCNYCLKICWSGLACDYCCWAMFCSDECRKKAWDAFHYVECSVLPSQSCRLYFDAIKIGLRILLVGIRETGSINKLREELKLVDECTSNCDKGFYKNGRFTNNTIQSIYSLKSRETPKYGLKVLASNISATLISIGKHGQLVENVNCEKIYDIIGNEDMIFLGSLLMRLTLISMNNVFSFSQMNCDCQRLKRSDHKCCDRGTGLSTLASLLNHSCNPNALRIFTEDLYINIFAVQPIKKGSQIFITYAAFYYNKPQKFREDVLAEYNITCDCEACVESWPPFFLEPNYFDLVAAQRPFEKKLYTNCKNIFGALDAKQTNFSRKDVKKLCKTMVEASTRLKQPTILMATLVDSLVLIYSHIYGWKSPIHVFGNCNIEPGTDSKQ